MKHFEQNIFQYNVNSPDLVIGSYNYINPKLTVNRGCGLKLFIDTLRKVNKTCCIIIVCNIQNRSEEIELYLNNNNANILYNDFKELHRCGDKFIIMKDIFLKYNQYKNILISDIADVMFQADPFIIKHNNTLYCACEPLKIGDANQNNNQECFPSKINTGWIKNYYSIKKIPFPKELYFKKNIFCAGTIFGDYNSIIEYITWFCNINKGKTRINDQGLYNVYCREFPDKCYKLDQNYGLILTTGAVLMYDKNVKLNKLGLVINENNTIYPILHQINRWGEESVQKLKNIVLKTPLN